MNGDYRFLQGDVVDKLKDMPSESVHCVVTSPPYWGLRDYGVVGQIGLESTPIQYIERMVEVFREVKRVLRKDGTLWINIGDSYFSSPTGNSTSNSTLQGGLNNQIESGRRPSKIIPGCKPKDLVGIPWMLAFALREDGWWLRQDIIWSKPNPMPESVTDRCTKAHEYIFLLTKSANYFYDNEEIKEACVRGSGGNTFHQGKTGIHQLNRASSSERVDTALRNKRSVWTIPTTGYKEAHFATFPVKLIEPCIAAGCPRGGGSSGPI